MEQPKDRYKILIEPQRGLFGLIQGDNMSVDLHAGHDSIEFDCDKNHRTLDLRLYGEKEGERWKIEKLTYFDRGSVRIELSLCEKETKEAK